MKQHFETVYLRLKNIALDKNILCSEFWKKIIALRNDFNEKEAWRLTVGNIQWLVNSKVIATDDLVKWFGIDTLIENNIYIDGDVLVKDAFAVGLQNARIKAVGHSRIILFDNAHADCFDTTFLSAHQRSTATLLDCSGELFDNASCDAKGYAKVEAWQESRVNADNYCYVIKHDNAQVNSSAQVYVLNQ